MNHQELQKDTPNTSPLHAFEAQQPAYNELENQLCSILADTYRIMLNTQGLHWNGQGRAFFGLHKLTEEQYRELFEAVDEIAERIRALSYPAPHTFTALAELSALSDIDASANIPHQLQQLAECHVELANRIKTIIVDADMVTDVGTVDLLTQRVRVHEKFAWLLRSVANS